MCAGTCGVCSLLGLLHQPPCPGTSRGGVAQKPAEGDPAMKGHVIGQCCMFHHKAVCTEKRKVFIAMEYCQKWSVPKKKIKKPWL